MPDYYINGPCLLRPFAGAHLSGLIVGGGGIHPSGPPSPVYNARGGLLSCPAGGAQLGITDEQVILSPRLHHQDLRADDFGPNAPANVLWMLCEWEIRASLIWYDADVLEVCLGESMGGTPPGPPGPGNSPSTLPVGSVLAPAGRMLGNGYPVLASGNHFLALAITSPVAQDPYLFAACYLVDRGADVKLGAGRSQVMTRWRSVPYVPYFALPGMSISSGTFQSGSLLELQSSGAVLFTRDPFQIT